MSSTLLTWLESLEKSWKAKDIDAAVALFRSCKEYQEDPFQPILTTDAEIRHIWQGITDQREIELKFDILTETPKTSVIRWYAKLLESDERHHEYDGIYVVDFSDNGECISFKQWWNTGPVS